MTVQKALDLWAAACDRTDIRWYLFKETLLCVNGLQDLPQELPFAQIAVLARDLPDLVEYVFPALPKTWVLNKTCFVNGNHQLVFQIECTSVLEINILYGVEDKAQMAEFTGKVKKAAKKARRRLKCRNFIYKVFYRLLGGLYTKTFGKLTMRGIHKITEKAFARMVALAGESNENAEFYCDCLTNKKPVLFQKTWFQNRLMLTCLPQEASEEEPNGNEAPVQYPVFSGYRDYLAAMYGDYENGLTDEIGCGLTVEEKDELRQHQVRCFEALTFLQALRKEFGLRYYLIAGSVLGAVRHGGFIPWDDDIDVGIRIEEIEEFEKVVKEHLPQRLPKGFTLEQSGANNPYPRMFSKICYEGRCCIDLWPLAPTFRDGPKAKRLWAFGKIITKVHYQKIGHRVTKFRKIVKAAALLLSDKTIMAMARRNERKYAHKQTPAYINLYSIYGRRKETFKREWLDDEATALFNGLEVPVVGHTKLYLTHLYGNYMAKPAPWKRASRHVARFSQTETNDA